MTSHFDDLEDDLEDLLSGPAPVNPELKYASHTPANFRPITERMYEEKCPKCRGSGKWHGDFVTRTCFACNGTGKKQFKTSPEKRAAATTSRIRGELRRTQEQADNLKAWIAEHQAEHAWLVATVEMHRARANGAELEGFQAFLADLMDKLN